MKLLLELPDEAALDLLIEALESYQDTGPVPEGWKSNAWKEVSESLLEQIEKQTVSQ